MDRYLKLEEVTKTHLVNEKIVGGKKVIAKGAIIEQIVKQVFIRNRLGLRK